MPELTIICAYWATLAGHTAERFRRDERGVTTAETIVWLGVALLGAAAIGAILWATLRDGANNVTVPAPAAP